jgi:hypothetical protein
VEKFDLMKKSLQVEILILWAFDVGDLATSSDFSVQISKKIYIY